MILQKSLYYADLLLKKHFLLLSMLKTDVLLNIFGETVIFIYLIFFDEQSLIFFNLIFMPFCQSFNLMHPY